MSDSPIQTLLQQRDARPVSGEHLETLGKRAAHDWLLGKFASLNDAVVDVVRSEHLSPEQVRRVVEFTNGDAYLKEFRKEGGAHRVVHFDCGPADPAQVLQDLNDGGGGSRYDDGARDYRLSPAMAKRASLERTAPSMDKTAAAGPGVPGLPKLSPPPSLPKKASSPYEDDLWALFGAPASALPYADPMQPLVEVRAKLAGVRDQLSSELDSLEVDYAAACDELYQHVKQAALDGASLADVVTAWAAVTEDPLYVKVAFRLFTPRFQREGVFPSYEALGNSLTKKASVGTVNVSHPIVISYAAFVDTLNKLASCRALQKEFADGADQAHELLMKGASGGVVGAVGKGLRAAGQGIDTASPAIAHVLFGPEQAQTVAPTLAKGLKATGLVGAGLVGNAALQSVTDRPVVQSALGAAKSVVPGTAEYQNRRYRTMTGQ